MNRDIILLSHGAGGKATAHLIDSMFVPRYGTAVLRKLGDGAVLPELHGLPVFTTDSHVIRPLFFPGGDIGTLAVNGTVNDVLMCGGVPKALSVAFILEEGLELETLEKICRSIGEAARKAGCEVVTGDTKVVERGRGHSIYINTTGIGERAASCAMGPEHVTAGDRIIINGPCGQHGIAVLNARDELGFSSPVVSDCRALTEEAAALRAIPGAVRLMHDPTRGGLATCLNEIARESGRQVVLTEDALPRDAAVESACELLGFDPLYIANEGKLIAVVAADKAEEACRALQAAGSPEAAVIGEITGGEPLVIGRSASGGERILDVLTGDPLPRIC